MPDGSRLGIDPPLAAASVALVEQDQLRIATGGLLRPGGMDLTRRMLEYSAIPTEAQLLDVGCGCGASLCWLEQRGYRVTGVDITLSLLQQASTSRSGVVQAVAERLPYLSDLFDAVLFECSLSVIARLMSGKADDMAHALAVIIREAQRVLRQDGWLLVSDVYARNPGGLAALRGLPEASYLSGALDLSELQNLLTAGGFEIAHCEDHSETMRQISKQLCQGHGSPQSVCDQAPVEPVDSFDLAVKIGRARPGYFILTARKR
jgi:arsenite methyltransferase